MTTTAEDPHNPHGASDDHAHPSFLAHHFDTPQQQFDSGKLGTWLFLTTEVLLFSGLFCAYSVYRANHPEIFEFAHQYLNKWLGALNTIILIFSSFTMAWGVRAAQTGQRKLCVNLLAITIVCGAGFMVVKGIEYKAKWEEVLLPGPAYNPTELPNETNQAANKEGVPDVRPISTQKADSSKPVNREALGTHNGEADRATVAAADAKSGIPLTNAILLKDAPQTAVTSDGNLIEQSTIARAGKGPSGLNPNWTKEEDARLSHTAYKEPKEAPMDEPNNAHIFFGIYFLMTGLHGLHVLAGMALIAWVLVRAKKGEFGPHYFSPVDFVGLYWHIVDLVWIFLFPLLYLIT